MKKSEMEKRSYNFDVKAEKRDDGVNRISGTPIVYNSPTDIGGMFREIIVEGALDGADLRDVPLLVNHNDQMIPVARSRRNNANSTMRLMVTPKGLDIEADLDTERNDTSRALYSAIERGDLSGMSFMFRIADERWEGLETDYPTRYIDKFEAIGEVSAVTHPAYEATAIYARSKEALDNARSALENARQQTGASVETDKELELAKAKFMFLAKY